MNLSDPIFILIGKETLDTDLEKARRGVKVRYLYPITRNNIEIVKRLMEFAEVRHMDSTPMRLRIVDSTYCLLRHIVEEDISEKICLFSHARDFVSSMKVFFEKLWDNALPAEERIAQLEIEVEKESLKRFTEKPYEIDT